MKKVYFPTWLLDSAGVTNLSVEHKMLLAGTAVSSAMTACGVIRLTDRVLATLGFLPSDGISAALELQRRCLAVFNEETREFFHRGFFKTNLTPAEAGLDSPWAKQINWTIKQVIAQEVAAAVCEEIAAQDLREGEKLDSVGVPTNILTAMPRLAYGKSWQKTERLVLLALYTDSEGHAAGLPVVNYDAIGALCTLPAAAVDEACKTLSAGGAICYSPETGEACVFERITNANKGELKGIVDAASKIRDVQVKRALNRHLKLKLTTRNQKNNDKSREYAPIEKKGSYSKQKEEEGKNNGDANASPEAATAAAEDKTQTPGSAETPCASGADGWQGSDAQQAESWFEQLMRKGEGRSGTNYEKDRANIKKLRHAVDELGFRKVYDAAAGAEWPSAAAKNCDEAGIFREVARIQRSLAEKQNELALQKFKADQDAAAPATVDAAAKENLTGRRFRRCDGSGVEYDGLRVGIIIGGKITPTEAVLKMIEDGSLTEIEEVA